MVALGTEASISSPDDDKGDVTTEKTEVIYGVEKVIDRTIHDWATTKERVDACFDPDGPSVILSVEPVIKGAIDFR
jgi:hypothetical protein